MILDRFAEEGLGSRDVTPGAQPEVDCPTGVSSEWGSSGAGQPLVLVGMRPKSAAQSRTKRPIVDGAANLKQEIGTSSGPTHLLRLVHSPIDEKVCGSFCNRSSDTQTGTVSLGVVDEPTTLTSEITVDDKQ